jgi:hypothetical protein
MTSKGLALAACIIVFSASSGASYAASAIHERSNKVERLSSQWQMPTETLNSFAAMAPDTPEHNTHVYHGGPKFND